MGFASGAAGLSVAVAVGTGVLVGEGTAVAGIVVAVGDGVGGGVVGMGVAVGAGVGPGIAVGTGIAVASAEQASRNRHKRKRTAKAGFIRNILVGNLTRESQISSVVHRNLLRLAWAGGFATLYQCLAMLVDFATSAAHPMRTSRSGPVPRARGVVGVVQCHPETPREAAAAVCLRHK